MIEKLSLLVLPRTLAGRVFMLFALSMVLFVGTGLAVLYRHQYLQHLDDTQEAASALVELATNAIEDSALIGDYDTITRTLTTITTQSPFRSATFTAIGGGVLQVEATTPAFVAPAPEWLSAQLGAKMPEVTRVVSSGGKQYGELRLRFDNRKVAAQLWSLLMQSAGLAIIALLLSLPAARALLARWFGKLGHLQHYASDAALAGAEALMLRPDTPLEIRTAIRAVERGAASMRDEYGQRIAVLMNSLVQHKSALDQAAIVCELDCDGRLTAVNEQFVRQSGYTREELLRDTCISLNQGWTPSGSVWRGTVAVAARAGERQWLRTIVPIFDADDRVEKYICIDFDISERKQFEDAVMRNALRQSLIARFSRKALEAGDLDELFEMATELACEGVGVPYAAVFSFEAQQDCASLRAASGFPAGLLGQSLPYTAAPGTNAGLARWCTEQLGTAQAGTHLEAYVVCSDRLFGALGVYAPQQHCFEDDDDIFLNRLANILATSVERADARAHLTWLAQYDTLTGLPNRHRLTSCLEQTIHSAATGRRNAGVMFIDLDRFKSVNDMLGHSAGDELLVQAGQRLLSCVGPLDVVARLGGDEFAVVLPQLGQMQDAEEIARAIVQALTQPFQLQGQQLFVSASVGIATYPHDGLDAATLLKNADTAMYRAKQNGRNDYRFYRAEMNANANAALRLQTERQLHLALERGEFELHYQPKVSLASSAVCGFEALLRWRHPERGLIAPIEFITILEETGLILQVGEWVIGEVCRQLVAWSAVLERVPPVAINLSARQLAHAGLSETVRSIVAHAGVDPRLLEFELTESMLMTDPEAAVTILQSLKDQGMRLSVDDFGTGYSSLAYLKRFPLDALKIDRTFVRDLPDDSDDAAITKAVISLAHSLNLKVVAEGVETLAHMHALEAYGCDEIQGYYISRPVPGAACLALLAERSIQLAA